MATFAQALERRRARQTYRTIAHGLMLPPGTVGRLLQRAGLNHLSALELGKPVRRYEHEAPGDLLHLDIKKLGRFRCLGHRVTGDRQITSEVLAGSTCMSLSTTIHGSPSAASSPTSKHRVPAGHC